MSSISPSPNPPVSITTSDPDSGLTIKKAVTDEVIAQARQYTNKILIYFFMAVVGAIAASVWNLNGQIYQAVGATNVSSKALEMEINRLREEIGKLQKQSDIRDCLDNKKVTDKAGCYRGN